MSDNKETEIQKMKRLGTKEYIRQLNAEKAKIKQEKDFQKTGQYSFKLDPEGLFVGGMPDPSTIVSKISTASPQDYIDYKTNVGSQTSTQPEEKTGYKAVEFKNTMEEKPKEKSKGGIIYSKPHQKKYYGDLI